MTVIVTSGGTFEPIDSVRGLTNTSTGRLGSLFADAFLQKANSRVVYVHGRGAAMPAPCQNLRCCEAGSVSDLRRVLREICESSRREGEPAGVIVHAMAVSDYTVGVVTDGAGTVLTENKAGSGCKISSEHDELVVRLRKTPKVIEDFRLIAPEALLVGFKLMSGVSKAELVSRSGELLIRNNCTYVVANLAEEIAGEEHKAYLVGRGGVISEFETKKQIANGVVELCLRRISCSG